MLRARNHRPPIGEPWPWLKAPESPSLPGLAAAWSPSCHQRLGRSDPRSALSDAPSCQPPMSPVRHRAARACRGSESLRFAQTQTVGPQVGSALRTGRRRVPASPRRLPPPGPALRPRVAAACLTVPPCPGLPHRARLLKFRCKSWKWWCKSWRREHRFSFLVCHQRTITANLLVFCITMSRSLTAAVFKLSTVTNANHEF